MVGMEVVFLCHVHSPIEFFPFEIAPCTNLNTEHNWSKGYDFFLVSLILILSVWLGNIFTFLLSSSVDLQGYIHVNFEKEKGQFYADGNKLIKWLFIWSSILNMKEIPLDTDEKWKNCKLIHPFCASFSQYRVNLFLFFFFCLKEIGNWKLFWFPLPNIALGVLNLHNLKR